MAKNITRHVQHIKSVDTTTITVDGQEVVVAKLPEWGDLKDGEIAVNYNDGYETISIRNNNNEVVAFPNINTVNTLIEEKAQAALTFDSTPTANSTNPVTSGGIKTYVDTGDSIQSLTTYQTSTPLAVGDTHDQALSKLSKIIDDNELITARALTDLNDTKQDEIDDLDEIRTGAALGATAIQTETQLSKGTTTGSGNAVTDISVSNHQITLTKGTTFLTEHQDLSAYADGAEYDSTNHLIYLKHGNTRLANPINAADFIKDGMVNTVGVTDDKLVITFNTDSGKENIEIPLSDIFDPSLYYTKEEIDEHELVTAAALTELHDTKADKDELNNIKGIIENNESATSAALNDLATNKQDKLEFDDEPTEDSLNPVTSDGIKTYVDTVAEDIALVTSAALNELNDTIEEIEVTIQNIQPELDFDDTPTAGSDNPVTSGGIKTYVDTAIDSLGNIVELNEPSVSTPLAVGDTYDQAFAKLTKIIRDNELTTAGALTELHETKAEKMISTTYADLVTLKTNGTLKPGTWYRITDYATTTTQEDTQSANHPFDVMVLAISTDTLSEEARAIQHSDDTYFANSNLNAWKVWYCLDNDTTRFAWADTTNGKGVIYRLIDEFNNDIKYDFKNIQFKRTITDGQYDENGTETWCYTLNLWYNNMCQDASIMGNTLPNDEGYISGAYDNVFGYATANDLYLDGVNTFTFVLGDNVMLSFDDDGVYFGIYSNTIGNSFHNNTIGNYFNTNTIGNNFGNNTIGNGFNFNTIVNYFSSNTIGNEFTLNTIGNNFGNNTIGNEFNNNTIGNEFTLNTIGNNFSSNMIGNSFYSNTIGNGFNANMIGNYFNLNMIGNIFKFNTIGNDFRNNTIGTRNGSTITTINYVRYIRVEDGVQYVNITTSATTSGSNWLQNITIAQGVIGTSSTRKVITHGTLNDTFRTTYQSADSRVESV